MKNRKQKNERKRSNEHLWQKSIHWVRESVAESSNVSRRDFGFSSNRSVGRKFQYRQSSATFKTRCNFTSWWTICIFSNIILDLRSIKTSCLRLVHLKLSLRTRSRTSAEFLWWFSQVVLKFQENFSFNSLKTPISSVKEWFCFIYSSGRRQPLLHSWKFIIKMSKILNSVMRLFLLWII